MAENTVEVNGVQFNAKNLRAAVEDVLVEPNGEGSAQYGNVIVDDDGYDDRIVNIVSISPTHVLPHINPTEVLNKCEEAIEQPFEEYVKKNTELWGSVSFGEPKYTYTESDVSVVDTQFTENEIQSIDDNENIGVSTTEIVDKDKVSIDLIDQR